MLRIIWVLIQQALHAIMSTRKKKRSNKKMDEKLNQAFFDVFGYDPETTGHVSNQPVTVGQLHELLAKLSGEKEEE